MTEIDSDSRLRFAPSPTGFLHVGGARTALFNWLLCRRYGGTFILRIEDTDEERSTHESTDQILESMRWLGMEWDEGPGAGDAPEEVLQVPDDPEGCQQSYFQSDRLPLHQKIAQRLWEEGHAFYSDTEAAGDVVYDHGHRDLSKAEQKELLEENDGNLPLKLNVPVGEEITFEDQIRGERTFSTDDMGDFIILKSNGSPVYNFACVVDDHYMDITHVLRGDDHIPNTPRQKLIYDKLGWEPPAFAHVPMILGPDQKRLSKRHGATDVLSYRERGVLAKAMVNFLALVGWHGPDPDREEYFDVQELIDDFSIDGIGKSPGVFDVDKLEWLNGRHLRRFDFEEFYDRLKPFIPDEWLENYDESYVRRVAELEQDRIRTLGEFSEVVDYFFTDDYGVDEEAEQEHLNENDTAAELFSTLHSELSELSEDEWTEDELEPVLRGVGDDLGIGFGAVAQPLRVALTGGTASPSIFTLVQLLGKTRVLDRIQQVETDTAKAG